MTSWKGAEVLVTGAGGFIGSHLVERLLALGAIVTAFVRYNSRNNAGVLELLGEKKRELRIVSGDIRELDTVRSVVRDAEIVFHLAALVGIPYSYSHPHEVLEVNTMGTLNVLTAAKDHRLHKVVVTSTSEVYGSAIYVPMDENHPKQSQSPYAASKIAADAVALSFYNSFELPVTIVRPFNTYGPRQSDRAIIPAIIYQALIKKEVLIGNTAPTRDFTFVADTVDGLIRVGESDQAVGQEINLGSGREISIADLTTKIAASVGDEIKIRQVEERIRPKGSEVTRLLSQNSKAKQLVGWEPRVDLEHGLSLTVDWIRNHLALYDPSVYRA
jgi:NAD dependent epimerase/dehydratase